MDQNNMTYKPSIISSKTPFKEPNTLRGSDKVASVGKVLGGKPKKGTLSKKFFGCSMIKNLGGKSIISELTYKEFKNARNATVKTCPSCQKTFKNIHDVNQKFCSRSCEEKGATLLKLQEEWHRPIQTEFETQDGKIIDLATVVKLVKRVMDDGNMQKLQACLFVAGMLKNCTGWTIVFAIDDYAKSKVMLDKLEI
jgi:hypothetical protein